MHLLILLSYIPSCRDSSILLTIKGGVVGLTDFISIDRVAVRPVS